MANPLVFGSDSDTSRAAPQRTCVALDSTRTGKLHGMKSLFGMAALNQLVTHFLQTLSRM